mgnify:CR=1 FL=1
MINNDKWINSLPKINTEFSQTINQLNHDKWINTIPKKNTYNSVKKYSLKKYSLITTLFVCGLLFVSVVKNETRNLQKEINNLKASINVIKFNLHQTILDNEVITSPENISLLAKEYLNIDLVSYRKSQIKKLNEENETLAQVNKIKKEKANKKKIKNLQVNIKTQVAKRIEKKKTEIRKLQELYQGPESIPDEIKTQVAKKIKEKKIKLNNIYRSPKDVFTLDRISRWGIVQVVKVFFGLPVVPGR